MIWILVVELNAPQSLVALVLLYDSGQSLLELVQDIGTYNRSHCDDVRRGSRDLDVGDSTAK